VLILLADVNLQGHVDRLVARMQEKPWRDFWDYLDLAYVTFADLGLDPADTDAVVWRRCQEHSALLLTNNRNDDGPVSLETTLRIHNTAQSLPIFTIGNADRILESPTYADQVIERLFQYLLELDNVRGTGRLYLP
jgi:hypothetical protein